ncbi:MAG: tyrosine--tRNA ligase [Culicoidibacterales bacterium]
MNIFQDLKSRGLIYQTTGDEEVEKLLHTDKQVIYCGVDPTGDSLHVGHLFPMRTLLRFAKEGHKIIFLVGGATGMIGDPGGKAAERKLLSEEVVRHNADMLMGQLKELAASAGVLEQAIFVNNLDWTKQIDLISFFRDYGKHFPLTQMLAKESVKTRLEVGISYTEFSYQVLQSLDFEYLYRTYDCGIQIGGSDQWGNMTAGMEFIRRKSFSDEQEMKTQPHVITFPLLTKADGTKFGKSEGGAIWLNAEKTSSFAFYQFWLNTSDSDVEKYMYYFSDCAVEEIQKMVEAHKEAPHLRTLQRALAEELTVLIHGQEACEKAIAMSEVLFTGAFKSLDADSIVELLSDVPSCKTAEDMSLVDALVLVGAAKSNREARDFIKGNAVAINGEKVSDLEAVIQKNDAIDQRVTVIKRGKKLHFLLIHE